MSWTHKVVKMQRDADGRWFARPGTGFASEAEAAKAGAALAAEQCAAGVLGTRVVVLRRRGNFAVRECRWEDAAGGVREYRWEAPQAEDTRG